jgi:hypothetical protein
LTLYDANGLPHEAVRLVVSPHDIPDLDGCGLVTTYAVDLSETERQSLEWQHRAPVLLDDHMVPISSQGVDACGRLVVKGTWGNWRIRSSGGDALFDSRLPEGTRRVIAGILVDRMDQHTGHHGQTKGQIKGSF